MSGPNVDALSQRLAAEEDRLQLCVHCGFCLPACPTYERLGDEADSPRGRLHLMRAVGEGRLDAGSDAFQTHMDRCLGCRACETVCPSGVPYGQLLETARSVAIQARPTGGLTRLLLSVFGSDGLRGIAMVVSRLARATGLPSLAARVLPDARLTRGARLASAMLAASGPSTHLAQVSTGRPKEGEAPNPVDAGCIVLTGCVQEGLFSRVNRATERTLRANGYRVLGLTEGSGTVGASTRTQGCCGALHAHAGHLDDARVLARRNIDAFYPVLAAGEAEYIVVNAAGCGAAMRDYGHLLEDDPSYSGRARFVSERVRDISEVLAEAGPRPGGAVEARVAYDAPCHLQHAQRVVDPPESVLGAIPGLERVALAGADQCCGGAGIYGITHPDLGGRIGGDKVDAVIASGAELLATGNPGCMMQIGAGLRIRGAEVDVVHPVELLDRSYEAAGYYE